MKKTQLPDVKELMHPLKPLPFFKNGSLVFSESGHVLRISDRHYRCDLDCRGKCDKKEAQIKKENLERSFSTVLKSFEIKPEITEQILDRLMRDNLVDIILGPEKESRFSSEIMDSTLAVAVQDFKKTGKIKKADVKDFEVTYLKQKQIDYSMILAGMTFDILRSITTNADIVSNRSKTFARIIKKIYLSDEGEILQLEFQPWGWYLMHLFDKNEPNYLASVKKNVKIVNTSNEAGGKKLSEAALYFATTGPDEALGQDVSVTKEWIKLLSDMFKSLLKHDVQGANQAQLVLLNMMRNLPSLELLSGIAPAFEQKPKRRT